MPQFETSRKVRHSADKMFALVADVEKYPHFLPLCEALAVRSRKERDGRTVLVADMTVGYKAIRETFTSQVHLKPDENVIDVKYLDGPFKYLSNEWRFEAAEGGSPAPLFFDYEFKSPPPRAIMGAGFDYEFKSRILGAMMGAMFDRAFRMFAEAFEKRADAIYGSAGAS